MKSRSAPCAVGLAALVALICACAEERPTDPATVVVAHIGDRTHTLGEFQEYLKDNLVGEEELDASGPEADGVKSRLFDAFLEERLLLLEADRLELQVSDFEVEAYLGLSEGARDSPVTRSDWEEASRRLKIEKLLEVTVNSLPPLPKTSTPQGPASTSGQGRRVRLRSLMLESMETATKVSLEIKRGHVTFNEAVVSHSTSPEQGLPIELSWEGLSEDHRRVLENLKSGEVSEPLDVGGGTYLFQVVAWIEDGRRDPEAQAEKARRRLDSARRVEAVQALLSKLRKNVVIKTFFNSLPFEYIDADSIGRNHWNRVVTGHG